MKKSRPATKLSVLCNMELVEKLKEIIFKNSTSLGIREYQVKKNMLKRDELEVETEFGKVRVKQSFYNGKPVHSKPENDDCRKLAKKHQVSISEIEKAVNQKLAE